MFNGVIRLAKEEAGQDVVEYSMLLVLIGVGAILVVSLWSNSLGAIYQRLCDVIAGARR